MSLPPVTDLPQYYTSHYEYTVPQKVIGQWLSGEGFGRTTPYSEEEKERLNSDIQQIFEDQMANSPTYSKVIMITAGAPGAGKTTLLEKRIQKDKDHGTAGAYTDPDAVCLKQMQQTFQAMVQENPESVPHRKEAYDYWRPGSNGAAHVLLARYIKDGVRCYFGTTSQSPMMANTYKFFKDQGYKIHLLHVAAPDEVRVQSIQQRDKEFIQTDAADIASKASEVVQRVNDTFFKYADKIEFYWRGHVDAYAKHVATWERFENKDHGFFHVVSQRAFKEYTEYHNQKVNELEGNRSDLIWENFIEHHLGHSY